MSKNESLCYLAINHLHQYILHINITIIILLLSLSLFIQGL